MLNALSKDGIDVESLRRFSDHGGK